MIPYRNLAQNRHPFHLVVSHRHTRLSVSGTLPCLGHPRQPEIITTRLTGLYDALDATIARQPEFREHLTPLTCPDAPPVVEAMATAAQAARVGPMAAVAGAFADAVLDGLDDAGDDGAHTLIIENGGDVALRSAHPTTLRLYTGWRRPVAPLFLCLPPGRFGVASSSGVYGHSLSLGCADLVTVVDSNGARADAFATAVANRVTPNCDLEHVLARTGEPQAVVIFAQGKLAYRGPFELAFAHPAKHRSNDAH